MTRIWKHPVSLEDINALCRNTLVDHLGIRFTGFTEKSLTAELPVDQRTIQPLGLLHGGATAALAETMGSVASSLVLPDHKKQAVVGIELNINHLKSERTGTVKGQVSAIRIGKKLHVWQIKIYNEEEILVSISRLTTMVIDRY